MATTTKTELVDRTKKDVKFGKELRKEFLFDEGYLNLNHGSFGTYPRAVQSTFRSFQDRAESRPDQWVFYDQPKRIDESREAMAKLLNAPVETLVFVPNATTGINTVLRNLVFTPGDHILYFATIYGACEKSVAYITETTPAESVKIDYTYPVEDDWLVSQLQAKVEEVEKSGGKVKVAIFDTVVSVPGVRMPFEKLVEKCRELGVLSCIDGAHGVGHVEINLETLNPDFFVSNCHKWLHTPRGCAIFHVPIRNQHLIRSTLPTSHGFIPRPKPEATATSNPFPVGTFPSPAGTNSAWVENFGFIGTIDNAPYLCIPAALAWRESIGGEEVIRSYCQNLARTGGQKVAEILGTQVMENSTKTLGKCCMSMIRLPLSVAKVSEVAAENGVQDDAVAGLVKDWVWRKLLDEYKTFMMVLFYGGVWWVRLSGQVYLELADFEWAAETLKGICERVERGEWVVAGSKL